VARGFRVTPDSIVVINVKRKIKNVKKRVFYQQNKKNVYKRLLQLCLTLQTHKSVRRLIPNDIATSVEMFVRTRPIYYY